MHRVSLGLCLVAVACGRHGSHGSASDSPVPSVDAAPRGVDLNFDGVSPADLFAALEHASGRKIDYDSDALPLVVCTTVTVHREHLDVPALADAVAQSIRPDGLVLAPSSTGWVVHRAPDAPREPCSRFLLDASVPRGPDKKKLAAAIAGIRTTGPTRYTIRESTRAMLVDPASDLLRAIRIAPEVGDEIPTFRFFGVVPTDVLGALGFVNGDQVISLCGRAPRSADAVREAFASLDGTLPCIVQIVRHGDTRVTLDYVLVPK